MHVISDDTQGENISQSVMIANSAFAQSEAGANAIKAIENAWNIAAEKINAVPENYRALLVKKANLSDDIAQTYTLSEYPQTQKPTQEQIDRVIDWMLQKNYLTKELAYDANSGTFSEK